MKTRKEQKTVIILELDEAESDWLKSIMQNALYEEETKWDSGMREKLFTALKKYEILKGDNP